MGRYRAEGFREKDKKLKVAIAGYPGVSTAVTLTQCTSLPCMPTSKVQVRVSILAHSGATMDGVHC